MEQRKKYWPYLYIIIVSSFIRPSAIWAEDISPLPLPSHKAEKEWWGASEENIEHAKCLGQKNFTTEELTQQIEAKHRNDSLVAEVNINGVNFVDEKSGLVELFKKLSTIAPHVGFMLKENSQKIFSLNDKNCNQVICASADIWGKDLSVRLLYLIDQYGLNGAAFLFDASSEWEVEELDVVLGALSDLPHFLLPIKKNHKLTHYTRGRGNGKTIANATFSFFDSWNEKSVPMRRYTVVHELGHYIDSLMEASKSKEYSFWKQIDGGEESRVSKYANTNDSEDFAESFVTFRYNPELLKRVSPEKYNFMRDIIFNGLSFESEESCKEINATSIQLVQNKKYDHFSLEKLDDVISCGKYLFNYLNQKENQEENEKRKEKLVLCLNNVLIVKAMVGSIQGAVQDRALADILKNGLFVYHKNMGIDRKVNASYNQIYNLFVEELGWVYHDKFNPSYLIGDETPSEFCRKFARYSYQNGKDLDLIFGDHFSFRNREDFDQISLKFCTKWFEMRKREDRPTISSIRTILREVVPKSIGLSE